MPQTTRRISPGVLSIEGCVFGSFSRRVSSAGPSGGAEAEAAMQLVGTDFAILENSEVLTHLLKRNSSGTKSTPNRPKTPMTQMI
jgi:hypothetical protein